MTNTFLYFWGAVFGLCLGSFTNVVILRDANRTSIMTDRSRCPHCLHTLAWYDLVPVLSYIWLRGRCRYCKKHISWQYPLVELAAAGLAVFSLWYGIGLKGSWSLAIGLMIVNLLFLALSVIDIRTMEIPVEYCILAGVIGGGAFLASGVHGILETVYGALAGAGSIAVILYGWKLLFKQEGIGSGDIWVAGAVGAVAGYPGVLIALLLAIMSGAILGMLLMLVRRRNLNSAIPFGPFLYLGMLLALVVGDTLISWYHMYWLA